MSAGAHPFTLKRVKIWVESFERREYEFGSRPPPPLSVYQLLPPIRRRGLVVEPNADACVGSVDLQRDR